MNYRQAMQQALDALDDAMQMLLPKSQSDKARRAAYALRAALAEQEPQCNPHPKAPHSFMRNASHTEGRYVCECEGWEPYEAGYQAGMEAALAEQHAKVATADASLGAALEAIDAALAEQARPTSEAGWLHRLDMEKSEAWMAGYAQGQKRAAEQAQPVATHSPDTCDEEVFIRGELVCVLAVPKEQAEAAVRLASALTGDRYDWHYVGGRVHVRKLAAAPEAPQTFNQ